MMSRTVARRYARGMLEAVVEVGEAERAPALAGELAGLADVVRGHPGLQLLVVNPAIPGDKKAAVLDRIAGRLELSAISRRFLRVLADKERLDHLGVIAEVFGKMVDDHRGVVTAEVSTPAALDDSQVEAIAAKLRDALDRPVKIRTRTDPDLLGGMVTRIGDVVYDGSLRSHLSRIRRQLSSA